MKKVCNFFGLGFKSLQQVRVFMDVPSLSLNLGIAWLATQCCIIYEIIDDFNGSEEAPMSGQA